MKWSDEAFETVVSMWKDGWSGGVIAERMKDHFGIFTTPAAIVSAMRRANVEKAGPRKPRVGSKGVVRERLLKQSSTDAEAIVAARTTMTVGEFECRAVIGEVQRWGPSEVCGRPIAAGSRFRFCAVHKMMFTQHDPQR